MAGAGRVDGLIDWILPLATEYTLQKSGAPFDTAPGISAVLNLLIRKLSLGITKHILIHIYKYPIEEV